MCFTGTQNCIYGTGKQVDANQNNKNANYYITSINLKSYDFDYHTQFDNTKIILFFSSD